MLISLLIIFITLLFLAFTEDYLGRYKWLMYIIIGIMMITCAGLRPIGFDRDSHNYEQMFLHPDTELSGITIEPMFRILCKLLYYIYPDVQILLFTFALMCITIKYIAIKRLTPLFFLPLIIYFGNFFLLHETTQIRAGMVSGLFLLALKPLSEGKKLLPFCLITFGALFHYSAVSLLPLLLLDNKPISPMLKIAMACIVPLCFLFYVLDLDLLTSLPLPYVTEKVEIYKMASEFGKVEKESILNPFPLMKMAVFLYFLYFSQTIEAHVPSINLIIKILGCSLLVYFAFSSVKIISTRISELYGIVEIIAYPCIIFTLKPVSIGKIIVCIMALIEIYFNVIQWGFFDLTV